FRRLEAPLQGAPDAGKPRVVAGSDERQAGQRRGGEYRTGRMRTPSIDGARHILAGGPLVDLLQKSVSQLQREAVLFSQRPLELDCGEQIQRDLRHGFAEQASGASFIGEAAPPEKNPKEASDRSCGEGGSDEQRSGGLRGPVGNATGDGQNQ